MTKFLPNIFDTALITAYHYFILLLLSSLFNQYTQIYYHYV